MEGQLQEKIFKWWGIKWVDKFCTLRNGRLTIGDRCFNLRQSHNINYAFEKISYKQAAKDIAGETELRLWKKRTHRGPVVRCEVTICTLSQKVTLRVTHAKECHKWCQAFTNLSGRTDAKSPATSPNKSKSTKLAERKRAEIENDVEEKVDLMKQAMELNRLATFLTRCKSKKKQSLRKVTGSKSGHGLPMPSQPCVTTESNTVSTVTQEAMSTVIPHLMQQKSSYSNSKSHSLKREAPSPPKLQELSQKVREIPVERVKRRSTVKQQSMEGTTYFPHVSPPLTKFVSHDPHFQSLSHSSSSSVISPISRHKSTFVSKPIKLAPKAPVSKYVKIKAPPGAKKCDVSQQNLVSIVSSVSLRNVTKSPGNHESNVRLWNQMRPKVPPKPKYLQKSSHTFDPHNKLGHKTLPTVDHFVSIKPRVKPVKREVKRSLDQDFPSSHCV